MFWKNCEVKHNLKFDWHYEKFIEIISDINRLWLIDRWIDRYIWTNIQSDGGEKVERVRYEHR